MASSDPPDDNTTPQTPHLVLKDDDVEPLSPDTEQNVCEQSDLVFRNFVYLMHTNSQDEAPDDTPCSAELTAFHDDPFGPTWQVGRQLAMIGDDIDRRYSNQFNSMIRMLRITPDTAYEAFAGVARKLFRDGTINWGRIVTLLCFGYRVAVTVLERGIRGFFHKIISYVCKFIVVEKIAQWIADQGGWRAVLNYIPESISLQTFSMLFALAAVSVMAVMYFKRHT